MGYGLENRDDGLGMRVEENLVYRQDTKSRHE